ncbi:hypothetical protein SDC9_180149 [bioreactor metagenome]|uniref:Uncharacterized protein n=1 Tax=bioreactor metagenome TaxID=1076179 RepID=A0A645H3U6_9ZZZZ
MESYQANNSFDYQSAAKATYAKYKALPEADRIFLKDKVTLYVPTLDLLALQDFFNLYY